MVPRSPGTVTVSDCWLAAAAAKLEPFTPWIQNERPRATTKKRRKPAKRRPMRRSIKRTAALPRDLRQAGRSRGDRLLSPVEIRDALRPGLDQPDRRGRIVHAAVGEAGRFARLQDRVLLAEELDLLVDLPGRRGE